MIPASHITGWRFQNPWPDDAQVEQDLVISRALVEIFRVPELYESVAFRGGTALYKLHVKKPVRYSEDIDLVQVKAEDSGVTIDALRAVLDPWLGTPKRQRAENSFKLVYRFESEGRPPINMRLKIEVNTREHFAVLGFRDHPFEVESEWFSGRATIKTYTLEELIGTKLRALYQRKKGRDLLDLWLVLEKFDLDKQKVIEVFQHYLNKQGFSISRADYDANLEEKMSDHRFASDTTALLAADFSWDIEKARKVLKTQLIDLLPE